MDKAKEERPVMPFGIALIRYIYMADSTLYMLSLMIFYNKVMVLGTVISGVWSGVVRILITAMPLSLYFGMARPKPTVLYGALLFHIFFVVNSLLSLFRGKIFLDPIIQMVGMVGPSYVSMREATVLVISIIIGLVILVYLFLQRQYFLKTAS